MFPRGDCHFFWSAQLVAGQLEQLAGGTFSKKEKDDSLEGWNGLGEGRYLSKNVDKTITRSKVSGNHTRTWKTGEQRLAQCDCLQVCLRVCLPVTRCVCLLLVEIATLTRESGKTVIRVLKQKEVEQLIKKHEEEEAKAEREKKEKEQKEKDK